MSQREDPAAAAPSSPDDGGGSPRSPKLSYATANGSTLPEEISIEVEAASSDSEEAGDELISNCQGPPQQRPHDPEDTRSGDNVRRCRLYKVPEQICKADKREHEPSYVSIGPYHYRSEGLQARSNLWKEQCVSVVKSRLQYLNQDADLLLDKMKGIEDEVRMYYDDIRSSPFPDKGQAFCEMMMTDGCFLVITLALLSDENSSITVSSNWDNLFWWHDILLYANQLPFVVVRAIYQLIYPGMNGDVPLLRYIKDGLKRYTKRKVSDPGNADHVLHMCHELLKPTDADRDGDGDRVGRWRRATEYSELLVQFKERDLDSEGGNGDFQCISDVRVRARGRVVEIPKLQLNPESWMLLRNLMLLEQMNDHLGGHVTAYCNFISQVASTSADVSLLVRRGIIVHTEANHERAAKKLSMLCDQIIYDQRKDYLKSDWQELDAHCRSWSWLLWAKLFLHKDWKNPLVTLGALAAIAILACAIVQTWYTVKAYKDQNKHPGQS
uniref:Uncharacterized protein n=1 Tax=Oryza glumipatula TaxID=40148 RepID=A0A0E0BB54_9ORYZ